jgi:hypothetical protein
MPDNTMAVSELPRRVQELTGGAATISYRTLYGRVLDGAVPAERRRGRWHVAESIARDLSRQLLDRGAERGGGSKSCG